MKSAAALDVVAIHTPLVSPVATASRLESFAALYARLALGTAFLSAVASRFGLWQGGFDSGRFTGFVAYTAEVNAFLPSAAIPFLAWSATACELSLGLALAVGFRLRWVALASAILLSLFGTAMAISLGIQSPLDYSVFSASAAALLVAVVQRPSRGSRS